jgi:hypothetical protein
MAAEASQSSHATADSSNHRREFRQQHKFLDAAINTWAGERRSEWQQLTDNLHD